MWVCGLVWRGSAPGPSGARRTAPHHHSQLPWPLLLPTSARKHTHACRRRACGGRTSGPCAACCSHACLQHAPRFPARCSRFRPQSRAWQASALRTPIPITRMRCRSMASCRWPRVSRRASQRSTASQTESPTWV
jgi:hypothetical protein